QSQEFLLGDNNYSTVVAEHKGNKSNITKHLLGKSDALAKEDKQEQGGIIETVKKAVMNYFYPPAEAKAIDVVYKEAMTGSDGEVSTFDKKINADMSLLFTEKLVKCHVNVVYNALKTHESAAIMGAKSDNCDFVYKNGYVMNEVVDKVDKLLSLAIDEQNNALHLDYYKGITYGYLADNVADFMVDVFQPVTVEA
ncbi:hypothetical protein RFI_34302, partial [Reticulomyxa filosa]